MFRAFADLIDRFWGKKNKSESILPKPPPLDLKEPIGGGSNRIGGSSDDAQDSSFPVPPPLSNNIFTQLQIKPRKGDASADLGSDVSNSSEQVLTRPQQPIGGIKGQGMEGRPLQGMEGREEPAQPYDSDAPSLSRPKAIGGVEGKGMEGRPLQGAPTQTQSDPGPVSEEPKPPSRRLSGPG